MLDHRIHTFMELCRQMNYRQTAEALHLTQPAVTQHIHYLEHFYGCKLFSYDDRQLRKTDAGKALESYLRSACYNELQFQRQLKKAPVRKIRIGATKSIGDYVITDKLLSLLSRPDLEISLTIDNTAHLLGELNSLSLDIVLLEGYFDKSLYDYRLMRNERLTGICAPDHPFAGKEVAINELLEEKLILREDGSGTREVLEHLLAEHNLTIEAFSQKAYISSFAVIEAAVSQNYGISFVYEAVAKSNPEIAVFSLKGIDCFHEFNYVYLKGTQIDDILQLLIF